MGSLICLFPDFLEGAEELGMVAQLQPSSYVNMDPAAFLSLAQCSHTTELAACMRPCSGACLTCLSGAQPLRHWWMLAAHRRAREGSL